MTLPRFLDPAPNSRSVAPPVLKFDRVGRIFHATGERGWMVSHTACPQTLPLGGDNFRVYFGTRDGSNRAHIGFVEVSLARPGEVLSISNEPVLSPGPKGHFDESGVYPGTIVRRGRNLMMYYMGRLNYESPRYGMAIGLAQSSDDGRTFERVSQAPVFDRNSDSPWMVSTPTVIMDDSGYRMWHIGGTGWQSATASIYRIRSATSADGMSWRSDAHEIVPFHPGETNHASPTVLAAARGWRMWFCNHEDSGYRLAYAWSNDGQHWQRDDAQAGLASAASGFDQEIAYPHAVRHSGRVYLFYSGNGFGRDGLGLAVAEDRA